MQYYVRVSKSRRHKVMIHKADCPDYLRSSVSERHGPYDTIAEAVSKAEELARVPCRCKRCSP